MEARLSPHFTNSQVDAAQKKAQHTTPRTYIITDYPSDKICFIMQGCQGSGNIHQMEVANLMNELGRDFPLAFLLFGGDNFYPHGVQSPVDECFDSQLHDMYRDPALTHINRLPGFAALGNHDGSRDTKSIYKTYATDMMPGLSYAVSVNPKKNEEAEQQQIAHSILISKPDLHLQNDISYADLPGFFMPHYFYAVKIGHFRLCVLNSNTYAKDFLHMMEELAFGRTVTEQNQAYWYQKQFEAAKAEGDTIFTLQHHPMDIFDKRNYEGGFDASLYLEPAAMTLLDRILKLSPDDFDYWDNVRKIFLAYYAQNDMVKNLNYNALLHDIIFKQQKIEVRNYFVAHSHNINYFNNMQSNHSQFEKICQITSGAGGEKLQDRSFFGEAENLGGFVKKHGCVVVELDKNYPEKFDIHLCSVDGMRLHFNNESSKPLQEPISNYATEYLRNHVLTACREYENFLHQEQIQKNGQLFPHILSLSQFNPFRLFAATPLHTHKMIEWMHEIMNYFNQPVLPPWAVANAQLVYFLNQIPETHPLREGIEKCMSNDLYLDWEWN